MRGLRRDQFNQKTLRKKKVKNIYAKITLTQNYVLLACCSQEHLGKTFEEGNIHFQAKESFYKGKKFAEKDLVLALKKADNINLFGEKPVAIALRQGYLKPENIIKIQGVPHAQIYKV